MVEGSDGFQSEIDVDSLEWKQQLSRAWWQTRRDPTGRYANLATVDEAGKPRVRTVVLRTMSLEPPTLCFGVDTRSAKVEQARAKPTVELCWYVHAIREQFRFAGELDIVNEEAKGPDAKLRLETWESLSQKVRKAFLGPPPGTPLEEDDSWELSSRDTAPPSCFSVGRVTIAEVDWLSIRGSRLERIASTTDPHGNWSAARIRP